MSKFLEWEKHLYGKKVVETTLKNAARFQKKMGGWYMFGYWYYNVASIFWKEKTFKKNDMNHILMKGQHLAQQYWGLDHPNTAVMTRAAEVIKDHTKKKRRARK